MRSVPVPTGHAFSREYRAVGARSTSSDFAGGHGWLSRVAGDQRPGTRYGRDTVGAKFGIDGTSVRWYVLRGLHASADGQVDAEVRGKMGQGVQLATRSDQTLYDQTGRYTRTGFRFLFGVAAGTGHGPADQRSAEEMIRQNS